MESVADKQPLAKPISDTWKPEECCGYCGIPGMIDFGTPGLIGQLTCPNASCPESKGKTIAQTRER